MDDPASSLQQVELTAGSVEAIARRLAEVLADHGAALRAPSVLTTTEAMAVLGYKDRPKFLAAVRRLGIPFTRLNSRRFVFRRGDINAVLCQRQVGQPSRRVG